MRYDITHTTRYLYQTPVSQCLNEVRLTPRELPGQRLLEAGINVQPVPAFLHRRKDYFGNDVTTFEVFQTHDRFVATAASVVEVDIVASDPDSSVAWEDVCELLASPPDETALRASEFVFESPFIPIDARFADYAQPTFTPGRPLVEALKELSGRIHEEFEYAPMSTSIDLPLTEVLGRRRGVCQDFAHVMIGALRSMRLAARYVSGYIRPDANHVGAQASHAWVSAFVPGTGWLNLDPTNNVMASDGHITLAWGRDYGDVTPVKGVALGGGGQRVEVEVLVQGSHSFPG